MRHSCRTRACAHPIWTSQGQNRDGGVWMAAAGVVCGLGCGTNSSLGALDQLQRRWPPPKLPRPHTLVSYAIDPAATIVKGRGRRLVID